MSDIISGLDARMVLDSRGNPTVEVDCYVWLSWIYGRRGSTNLLELCHSKPCILQEIVRLLISLTLQDVHMI